MQPLLPLQGSGETSKASCRLLYEHLRSQDRSPSKILAVFRHFYTFPLSLPTNTVQPWTSEAFAVRPIVSWKIFDTQTSTPCISWPECNRWRWRTCPWVYLFNCPFDLPAGQLWPRDAFFPSLQNTALINRPVNNSPRLNSNIPYLYRSICFPTVTLIRSTVRCFYSRVPHITGYRDVYTGCTRKRDTIGDSSRKIELKMWNEVFSCLRVSEINQVLNFKARYSLKL